MKKNIITVSVVLLLLIILICTLDIQTPEEYYGEHSEKITDECMTVTLSVDFTAVRNDTVLWEKTLQNNPTLPENGIIVPETQYVLYKGDTVFEILIRSLKDKKIQLDYSGGDGLGAVYIKGINNLYEYDCGDLSGWMYSVNGEFPQVSCSDYELNDGDVVSWRYSCELGHDIGDNYYSN